MSEQAPQGVFAAVDLAARLRAAEDEVSRLRGELQRVESSAAFQVGSVVAEAMRHPGSAPRNVVRLYRRWRQAGNRSRAPSTTQPRVDVPDGAKLLADLVPLAVTRGELPVIAGVLNPTTRYALEPSADVVALAPTYGRWLLDRTRPDVLIVDSSAGLSGPWAQLGTYAGPERDRDLLQLLRAARALAVPTVAWRSVTPSSTPLFQDAEDAFDVVLDVESDDPRHEWNPGVQLRNFNPITAGSTRPASSLEALARGEQVAGELPAPLKDLSVDGPRDATDQRTILRVIFDNYATPIMLARLLATVDIDYELPGRAVSLYLRAARRDDTALVDSVLAQVLRPREVVVAGSTEPTEWTVAALRASGLSARAGSSGAETSAAVPDIVTDAAAPLVAVRTGAMADEYELADLVLAAECSDADVVGYTDEDFAFVQALPLEASLIRREVAERLGTANGPALSAASGLRCLGISRVGQGR